MVLFFFLAVVNTYVLAAPLGSISGTTSWVTKTFVSHASVLETATQVVTVDSATTRVQSILLSMPSYPITSLISQPSLMASGASLTSVVITNTAVAVLTDTTTVTGLPTTITVSAVPSTVTDFVTVLPSSPPVASTTTWAAPSQMTDLEAFNISAFPGGQRNLEIVNGIPANASATSFAAAAKSTASNNYVLDPSPTWDNSSSVLQLLYPADSINPGSKPLGGAEFYATPLPLAGAQDVTLEYSVFFPADFNWVLAGKLPGFYGGHTGCSGGDDGLQCFSTRLMWREGGAGELYLVRTEDVGAWKLS